MPATSLRRKFNEMSRANDGVMTAADICRMAHYYFVSVEAVTCVAWKSFGFFLAGPGSDSGTGASGFERRSSNSDSRIARMARACSSDTLPDARDSGV